MVLRLSEPRHLPNELSPALLTVIFKITCPALFYPPSLKLLVLCPLTAIQKNTVLSRTFLTTIFKITFGRHLLKFTCPAFFYDYHL